MAQRLKHLPAIQQPWVRSLGWEDPLEKEMATHSSILAWRIPWTEEPVELQSMGSQRVRHDCATSLHFTSSHSEKISDLTKILFKNRKTKAHKGQVIWPNLSPVETQVQSLGQEDPLDPLPRSHAL